MPLAGHLRAAQLFQHDLGRRRLDVGKTAVSHHVWLPPTPPAAPLIAQEALHAQPLVVCIVPTLDPAAATIVARSLRIISN
jgi:hypothetical protein